MDRFPVVLLLDADTRLSPNYLNTGLPLFNDHDVAAVLGCSEDPCETHRRRPCGAVS